MSKAPAPVKPKKRGFRGAANSSYHLSKIKNENEGILICLNLNSQKQSLKFVLNTNPFPEILSLCDDISASFRMELDPVSDSWFL